MEILATRRCGRPIGAACRRISVRAVGALANRTPGIGALANRTPGIRRGISGGRADQAVERCTAIGAVSVFEAAAASGGVAPARAATRAATASGLLKSSKLCTRR
jgi:hypothetical protein